MIKKRDIDIIMSNSIDWNKMKDKTVLITGATGRLGIYFVAALCEADKKYNLNIKIILVARNKEKIKKIYGQVLEQDNIECIIQDIIEPVTYEDKVDFIIHTAGAASPMDFTNDPVGTLWGHLQGTRNVLEFARKNKIEKVLYISTVEIYGEWNSEDGIKENDMGPIHCDVARSCYPEAKRMCETMLASYKKQYNLNYVIIRLCHTLGPGISLDDGRAFAQFISNALNGEDIVLQSDGSAMRTYTYVADAVGAAFLAFTKGTDSSYNVANLDNLISIKNLAELIASYSPSKKTKVKYSTEISGLNYLNFRLGIMNIDRVKSLGWQPLVDCKNTFKFTIESLLEAKRN